MRARHRVALASVLVAAALGGAVLAGCGGQAGSTTTTSPTTAAGPTTEVPADMKDTVAAQVFTAMAVKAGDSGDTVIAKVKEVAGQKTEWALDPNVTLGAGQDGKTSSATYTFGDGSTLKVMYATTTGLPADNKLVGVEFTKK